MSEFSQLVDLIAVLNQVDSGPGLRAVVHVEGDGEPAACSVEARRAIYLSVDQTQWKIHPRGHLLGR